MSAFIRIATAANVRAFHNLSHALSTSDQQVAKAIDPEELEDEIGRFRVWIGNLGAIQKGHSSLDYRLRDSPLLSNNALKFLEELEDNLNEALAVVSGARLPYELQQIPEQSEADVEEDDDFFDKDDEGEEGEDRSELRFRFAEIVDIIDNLYSLSVRIRTPTIRSRSLKAASFNPKDPETGVDILGMYAKYDIEYVQELLSHLRQPHLAESAAILEHDYLVARLSAAITLRRRQFKYWKRHRDKLGAAVQEETGTGSLPLARPVTLQRNDTTEAQPEVPTILAPNDAPSQKTGKTLLSGTEATQHHQSLDEIVDTKSVTSYAVTVKDMHGKGVDLPPPPRAANGEKDFECPYCYIICPARYGRGRAWRTHLLQDLQPYVCTLPDCDSAEQLFRSRREWVEHEASHRKAWRCPEHPTAVYKSSVSLKDHLRSQHADSIPSNQLPTILKVGETTTVDTRPTCPICCVNVGAEGLGDFHNHIANHLERIATFALPSGKEEDSDGASSEASRGRSGSRSSRNISESSFTNDSVDLVEESETTARSSSPENKISPASDEVGRRPLLSLETLGRLPDATQTRLNDLFQGHMEDREPDRIPPQDYVPPDSVAESHRAEYILDPVNIPSLRVMYRSRQLLQRDQSFAPNDSYNRIISFCHHDITKIGPVDCIVNSASRKIRMGNGDTLNNALLHAAGQLLTKELKGLGKLNPNEAIVTGGYQLPSKYVIHILRPRNEEDFNQLVNCYQSAFEAAANRGMKTIAFPCIGTGGIGLPPRAAARYALETTRKYLDAHPDHPFERIIFCVNTGIDEQAYLDFLPVYMPPTHSDLDEARSSAWSADRSSLATRVKDTQTQIQSIYEALDTASSLSVIGFLNEEAVFRTIDTALASLRKVLLWSQQVTQNVADINLFCSAMQLFCGSITEIIELAKDHAAVGQESNEAIWYDYASDFRARHSFSVPLFLKACEEFVVSLEASVTGGGNAAEQMPALRKTLERYKIRHRAGNSGEGTQDHLNQVLYTREFQRETISQSRTRDTVKLHQILSVSQLYKIGELEEKATLAHPSALFNHTICFTREDITKIEVDVIINSSDAAFSGMGSLNRSVLMKGGYDLQDAVKKFGTCAIGDVKTTKGYSLPAKHIVHVIPPNQLDNASKDVLRRLYRDALQAAVKLRATSLAIPSIGTGMLNYPRRDAASLALEEIKRFLETAEPKNLLEKIVLVAYSSDDEFIHKSLIPVYFPPIDLNLKRGYPQVVEDKPSSGVPKRTLFGSVGEAFRSVRFGKLPAISRSITANEEHALIQFETHAKTCDTCRDVGKLYLEGRDLCNDGYALAQRILWNMNMHEDQTIWSTPGVRGTSVSLDVSDEIFPICTTLLSTVERSYRDAGHSRPFVSTSRSFGAITKDQAQESSTLNVSRTESKDRDASEGEAKKARAHIFVQSQASDTWDQVFSGECDVRVHSHRIVFFAMDPEESLMILEMTPTTSVERAKTSAQVHLSNAMILKPQKYAGKTLMLMFRCPSDPECNSLLRMIRRAIEALSKNKDSQETEDEKPLATRIMECLTRDLVERPGSYIGKSTDSIVTTLQAPLEDILRELAELKAKGALHNTVNDDTWVVSEPPKELPVLSNEQREATQQESKVPAPTIRAPSLFNPTPPSPSLGPSSPPQNPAIDAIPIDNLYIRPSPANPKWTRVDKRLIDARVLVEADEAFDDMGEHLEVHRVLRRGEIERWVKETVAVRHRERMAEGEEKVRRDEERERMAEVEENVRRDEEWERLRDLSEEEDVELGRFGEEDERR